MVQLVIALAIAGALFAAGYVKGHAAYLELQAQLAVQTERIHTRTVTLQNTRVIERAADNNYFAGLKKGVAHEIELSPPAVAAADCRVPVGLLNAAVDRLNTARGVRPADQTPDPPARPGRTE